MSQVACFGQLVWGSLLEASAHTNLYVQTGVYRLVHTDLYVQARRYRFECTDSCVQARRYRFVCIGSAVQICVQARAQYMCIFIFIYIE